MLLTLAAIVDFVYHLTMRVERERSEAGYRWSLQTTGVVDSAVATVLVGALLLVAHLFGVDTEFLQYFRLGP